jgi:hypothetical protein
MKKQHLTESEIMRKYSNIVAEAEQLDEGMMDTIKSAFSKAIQKLLSPEDLQKVASIAQQATGGDLTPTKENAIKLVQALGITQQDVQQAIQSKGGQPVAGAQPVSEKMVFVPDSDNLIKPRILSIIANIVSVFGGTQLAIASAGGIGTGIGLVMILMGLVLLRVIADDIEKDANFRKNYKPSTGPDDLDKYIANKAAIKQGKPAPY